MGRRCWSRVTMEPGNFDGADSRRTDGGWSEVRAARARARSEMLPDLDGLSVEDHIERLGKAPRAYAYDRAAWSAANVDELKQLGVAEIGLAPRGRSERLVSVRRGRCWSRSEHMSKAASAR